MVGKNGVDNMSLESARSKQMREPAHLQKTALFWTVLSAQPAL